MRLYVLNALTFSLRRTISPPHNPNNNFCCMGCNWCRGLVWTRPSGSIPGFNSSASSSSFLRAQETGAPGEISLGQSLASGLWVSTASWVNRNMSSVESSRVISSAQECAPEPRASNAQSTHVPGALIGHNSFQAICFYMFIPEPVEKREPATVCRFICPPGREPARVIETVCSVACCKTEVYVANTLVFSLLAPVRGLSRSLTRARGQKSLVNKVHNEYIIKCGSDLTVSS